jgi:hypothetical protein
MPKKRFQPEEIIGILRHADMLQGRGKRVAKVVNAKLTRPTHCLVLPNC